MLSFQRLWNIGSKKLKPGKHKLLAIGLSKGVIVSIGVNHYTKSHPQQAKHAKSANQPDRIFLHAEIDCLTKATKPIDTMIVLRTNKVGNFANAKPCPVCQHALKGIKNVYHS